MPWFDGSAARRPQQTLQPHLQAFIGKPRRWSRAFHMSHAMANVR